MPNPTPDAIERSTPSVDETVHLLLDEIDKDEPHPRQWVAVAAILASDRAAVRREALEEVERYVEGLLFETNPTGDAIIGATQLAWRVVLGKVRELALATKGNK